VLTDAVTERSRQTMKPRFNAGDFSGGVVARREELDRSLTGSPSRRTRRASRSARSRCRRPRVSGAVGPRGRRCGVLDAATRESLRAKLAALEAQDHASARRRDGEIAQRQLGRGLRQPPVPPLAARPARQEQRRAAAACAEPSARSASKSATGLKGTLTDAIAKDIIQNSITPRFKANDFPAA
jgi:uncharacterized membrane protein YgcG